MKQTIKLRPITDKPVGDREIISYNIKGKPFFKRWDWDSIGQYHWEIVKKASKHIGWLYADELEFIIEVNND
jgi:hypothetical protein